MKTFSVLMHSVAQSFDTLARSRIPWWLAAHFGWLLVSVALLTSPSRVGGVMAVTTVAGFVVALLFPLPLSWRRMHWHQQQTPFMLCLLAVGLVFFATDQRQALALFVHLPLAWSAVLPIAALFLLLSVQFWDNWLCCRASANAAGSPAASSRKSGVVVPSSSRGPHRLTGRLTGGGLALLAFLLCPVSLFSLLATAAGFFGAAAWVNTLSGLLFPLKMLLFFGMLLLGGKLLGGLSFRKGQRNRDEATRGGLFSTIPAEEPAVRVSDPPLSE